MQGKNDFILKKVQWTYIDDASDIVIQHPL